MRYWRRVSSGYRPRSRGSRCRSGPRSRLFAACCCSVSRPIRACDTSSLCRGAKRLGVLCCGCFWGRRPSRPAWFSGASDGDCGDRPLLLRLRKIPFPWRADGQRVALTGGGMRVVHAITLVAALAAAMCAAAAQGPRAAPDGAVLFKEHCSMCHVSGGMKGSAAPSVEVLGQKTREEILRALESGAMTIYGNRMMEAERRAVAAYLSSKTGDGAELVQANFCSTKPA